MTNFKTHILISTVLMVQMLLNVQSIPLGVKMKPLLMINEIGGSLLEMIASPYEAYKEENTLENSDMEHKGELSKLINSSRLYSANGDLLLSTGLKENNITEMIIHSPSLAPSTPTMHLWAFSVVIIFGTFYLLIRSGYTYLKNFNHFFAKGMISLSNQILLLFICFALLLVTFIYGSFDSIYVNWEYLLGAIAFFIIGWIVLCTIILLLSMTITKKWNYLESIAQSFTFLKEKIKESPKITELYDAFELLVLKRYFFVPLFPMLKASSLRKDMKFSVYLDYCLMEKLRLFFKPSWTCWLSLIFMVIFWNVFILPSNILFATIFLMLIPLVGVGIVFTLYLYMRNSYRKIVLPINNEAILDFKDTDYASNDLFHSLVYPVYLKEIIDHEGQMEQITKKHFTIHEHMHQRHPSLYENIFFLGKTTFYFILNTIQCCCVIFLCWLIVTFSHYTPLIMTAYTNYSLFFIIPIALIYAIAQCYVVVLALKWLTMISSIEMKRNEKCIQKLINHHLKKAGKIADNIFIEFKKIYFDKRNENFGIGNQLIEDDDQELQSSNKAGNLQGRDFSLTFPTLMDMIKVNYLRFKKNETDPIIIEDELVPFLKSCGNRLTKSEIEFMYHLVDRLPELNGKLYLNNFNDICGAILCFRKLSPEHIIKRVFECYYQQNRQLFKETQKLKWKNIELFLESYQQYFNKEMVSFLKDECAYIGDVFALDSFIATILSPRQFYPF